MNRFMAVLLLVSLSAAGKCQDAPTIEATLIKSIRAPRDVTDMAFSPDDKLLAAGSRGHITVWNDKFEAVLDEAIRDTPAVDNANDPLRAPVNNEPVVRRVLFSPDSKLLAATCVDSDVRVYDMAAAKLLYHIYGNGMGGAYCLAFSHDGKLLATGGHDKLVNLYDAITGKPIRKLDGHTHNVVAVAFTADDKQVVSAGVQNLGRDNAEVNFWNADTGELADNRILSNLAPFPIDLPRDGRILAGVNSLPDGTAFTSLWNTATGELVRRLSVEDVRFDPPPNHIGLSLNSRIVMGWYQPSVRDPEYRVWNGFTYFWTMLSGQLFKIHTNSPQAPAARGGPHPGARALSADNKTLAVALSTGVIELWALSTG